MCISLACTLLPLRAMLESLYAILSIKLHTLCSVYAMQNFRLSLGMRFVTNNGGTFRVQNSSIFPLFFSRARDERRAAPEGAAGREDVARALSGGTNSPSNGGKRRDAV